MIAARLELEDLPQEANGAITLALVLALEFCAAPETFPVFRAFCAQFFGEADAPADVREAFADLSPEIVGGFADALRAGYDDPEPAVEVAP